MGYRRRRRYYTPLTKAEAERKATAVAIALFLAGFFCFGVTWIAIPFLFSN